MKCAAADYIEKLSKRMEETCLRQEDALKQAAETVADTIERGGRFYTFGSGHSAMVAEELYARAGGLAVVKAIVPNEVWAHDMGNKSSMIERLEGYGEILAKMYRIEKDDCLLVISNSGRNPAPVELALAAKKIGCSVIAITSLKHSKEVSSRHSSGKRLFEVADVVLDNGAEKGDASYYVEGFEIPVGPTSDAVGIALAQAIVCQATEDLVKKGIKPEVFKSSNLDGADEYNQVLFDKYHNYWK